MLMLNRISGWLLFTQACYLAAFITLSVIDVISRGVVFRAIAAIRHTFGLQNTYFRLSDYLTYPLACSAPLNLACMLVFFWSILQRRRSPSLSDDFFSISNMIYVVASGWVLFGVFMNIVHK